GAGAGGDVILLLGAEGRGGNAGWNNYLNPTLCLTLKLRTHPASHLLDPGCLFLHLKIPATELCVTPISFSGVENNARCRFINITKEFVRDFFAMDLQNEPLHELERFAIDLQILMMKERA